MFLVDQMPEYPNAFSDNYIDTAYESTNNAEEFISFLYGA